MAVYDPKKVILDRGGYVFTGFQKGTFIKIGRNEDSAKLDVGSTGEFTVTRNQNKSGKCTMTFMQDSLDNDYCSAEIAAFEADTGGIRPLLLKDLRGNTIGHAEQSWFVKPTDIEYGNDASNREWVLEMPDYNPFAGGSD